MCFGKEIIIDSPGITNVLLIQSTCTNLSTNNLVVIDNGTSNFKNGLLSDGSFNRFCDKYNMFVPLRNLGSIIIFLTYNVQGLLDTVFQKMFVYLEDI